MGEQPDIRQFDVESKMDLIETLGTLSSQTMTQNGSEQSSGISAPSVAMSPHRTQQLSWSAWLPSLFAGAEGARSLKASEFGEAQALSYLIPQWYAAPSKARDRLHQIASASVAMGGGDPEVEIGGGTSRERVD
ncbi:hypothetical protein [Allorhodopirellula heiligendammensis]|uniref:Uncharacterized protein n=1 Tax=Allorhodopirellula heiligendammensis TaxID=2714739 RepID=A0A5C6BUS1_9BACT|nr:hypothetical protein [Allorhodopirellula heiligendammensis]TWU15592.1 hypothetical protein Poly21_27890 [Allorhodopirellula heiligendammensis]